MTLRHLLDDLAWRTALVTGALLAVPAFAQGAQTVQVTTGFQSVYDTNILQYSDAQLRRFDAGTHPEQFAIQSRDDVVWGPHVLLQWEQRGEQARRRSLRLRGDGDFHQRNGTADFHSFSVGWRESFSGDRRLALSWYVLPRYYVRELYDQDLAAAAPPSQRYDRAEFGLQIASAAWTHGLTRRARLDAEYQLERRDYNRSFDERDSDTHRAALGASWSRLPGRASIGLEGGYRWSRARAGEGIDPQSGNPYFLPDVSYHGPLGSINGAIELLRASDMRLTGDLQVSTAMRVFESQHLSDRYHYGRRDLSNALEVGVRAAIPPHWATRVSYRYETNGSDLGAAAPPSADSGDYHAHQLALSIDWSGVLWRSESESSGRGSEP